MSALTFGKELSEAMGTCAQQGCKGKGKSSVVIAGYPVQSERLEALERRVLVCRPCRKEMEREWAEALEGSA